MIHSFAESLKVSEAYADDEIWPLVYMQAFPNFAAMSCVRNDGWAQRGGIDRVIVLSSGKVLTIDEKVREKDYGDVLLEYWSDVDRKIPGWVAKDLACDFIAYAVMPSKVCYLLPFHALRRAWQQNGREWVDKYKKINADNGTYTTVSVGVPVKELFGALNRAMVVNWAIGGASA